MFLRQQGRLFITGVKARWLCIIQIMYSDTDHMLISDSVLKAQGKMFCQVLSEAALRARALRNCLRLVTVPLSPDWCRATGMGFPLADSSISADRGILKLGWDNHYVLHSPPRIWIMVLFPASTFAQWSLLCWEHCSSKSLYSSWNDNLTWFYRGGFKALCLFLYSLNERGLCLDKCVPFFFFFRKSCPMNCICPKRSAVKFQRHFNDDQKETGCISDQLGEAQWRVCELGVHGELEQDWRQRDGFNLLYTFHNEVWTI